MSENAKVLREMLDIQGSDGNWNYDEYMHGMYNGMEFALSIIENREPIYREKPTEFLCDKESRIGEPVKAREEDE